MLDKFVLDHFFGITIMVDVYLVNRLPSRILDFQTPLDVLQKTCLFFLCVKILPQKLSRCVAYVHVYSHHQSKLNPYVLNVCLLVCY